MCAKNAGVDHCRWPFLPSSRKGKIYQWIYGANGPWHVPHRRQWKLKKGDRRGWMADSLLKDTSPWERPAFRPFQGWPSTGSHLRSDTVTGYADILLTNFSEIFVSTELNTDSHRIFEKNANRISVEPRLHVSCFLKIAKYTRLYYLEKKRNERNINKNLPKNLKKYRAQKIHSGRRQEGNSIRK